MKESFDALIDHLVKAGFFMEQAVEILEKGMIERVLSRTEGNQEYGNDARAGSAELRAQWKWLHYDTIP